MNEPVPEFSRVVTVSRIPPHGIEESLEARPAERTALAERFDLLAIKSLKAELQAVSDARHIITVTGTLHADVTQSCVVTMEPVDDHLDIDVATHFIPDKLFVAGAGSPFRDDSEEEVEVYSDGKIDLGELVAQYLGIGLNPHPRKKGAALPPMEFSAPEEKPKPFAQLKILTKTPKNTNKTDK